MKRYNRKYAYYDASGLTMTWTQFALIGMLVLSVAATTIALSMSWFGGAGAFLLLAFVTYVLISPDR